MTYTSASSIRINGFETAATGMKRIYFGFFLSIITVFVFCCLWVICKTCMKRGSGSICPTHCCTRAVRFGWRSYKMPIGWHKWMLLLLLNAVLLQATGGEWPQWRGPNRDGVLTSADAPVSWSEHLKATWKLTVGEGHASPILAGGRIFIFTRQQDKEVASGIDLASGKVVWQQSYPAPFKMHPAAVRHGEGPKSTPLFHDGKLYTLGISGILTCWDGATGAVRWRKEFQYREKWPLFGTAMSPLVDRGLLIAHVGGNDDGALTAFDAASGEVKWQWKGDGPAYASPIVGDFGGTRQVI